MKLYFANTCGGDNIVVKCSEVVEKAKTYQVVGDSGYRRSIHKDEIGKPSMEFVHGVGLTKEEAVDTFRKSAELVRDKYQRQVDFYDKLARIPVVEEVQDGSAEI